MSLALRKKIENPIRVMVVDDSAVIRGLISKMLETDSEVEVVVTFSNGLLAVKNLSKYDIDVIVLDIEMPVMDGLTALPKLLEKDPEVKIVMASTLTARNADVSIRALKAGAADYVSKPSSTRELTGADDFRRELVTRVKSLGEARRRRRKRKLIQRIAPAAIPASTAVIPLRKPSLHRPKILAIGSSTGGPQALFSFFDALKPSIIKLPVVVTQHMPATFTTILADHITRQTSWECHEGKDGEIITGEGKIYLAPGGYHMLVEKLGDDHIIRLNKGPQENYCRPAVDPMLRSLVKSYGSRVLTVIFTGMGADGLKGSGLVVEAGGAVIAQDEATSVVWGMPGAVSTAGLCCAVLPISEMAKYISKLAG